MDRRLTAYVLKYLLEHRFESKAEMARQLGMRQRTIEKVFANLDVAKAGTIAFDKAIYYCAENHISLDSILESFIEEMKDGVATNETNQQAFNKLRMTKPLSLTTDGEEVYASMLLFLRKTSAHTCPVCKTWCNPWDPGHHCLHRRALRGLRGQDAHGQIDKAARDHDTKNQERKRTSLQGHFGGGGRRHTQGIGGRAL